MEKVSKGNQLNSMKARFFKHVTGSWLGNKWVSIGEPFRLKAKGLWGSGKLPTDKNHDKDKKGDCFQTLAPESVIYLFFLKQGIRYRPTWKDEQAQARWNTFTSKLANWILIPSIIPLNQVRLQWRKDARLAHSKLNGKCLAWSIWSASKWPNYCIQSFFKYNFRLGCKRQK